ncbi:MAG: hypothetical protein AB1486_16085 [Planctomycetota bacterium]
MISIADLSADTAFLGDEFLTWLWFRMETGEGTLDLPGFGEVGVAFDRYLEFHDELSGARLSLRSDAVSRTTEAQAALSVGKKLRRARLVIGWLDQNIELTVDGSTLDLGGLKLPRPTAEDSREREAEAAAALQTAASLVAALFTVFLRERLAPDFEPSTLEAMRRWVRSRSNGQAPQPPEGDASEPRVPAEGHKAPARRRAAKAFLARPSAEGDADDGEAAGSPDSPF